MIEKGLMHPSHSIDRVVKVAHNILKPLLHKHIFKEREDQQCVEQNDPNKIDQVNIIPWSIAFFFNKFAYYQTYFYCFR